MTRHKPESELRYHRKSPRPNHLDPGSIEESRTRLLPTDTIRQIARETGFVVRERKIDPVALLWTLVLDFGVRLHRLLEELRVAYVTSSELEEIASASYYVRFTPKLSEYLRRCLDVAIPNLPQEPGRELDPRLGAFVVDVVIKDSSVVRPMPASRRSSRPPARARSPPGSRSTRW